MKAPKASICVAVTALALSLPLGAPTWAAEDEASTLTLKMKELYRAGKYQEALPLAQKSLAPLEKQYGPDDANVAMPLNDLGTIHDNLGQHAVADTLYKRSLALLEKTLGPNHPDLAGEPRRSLQGSGPLPRCRTASQAIDGASQRGGAADLGDADDARRTFIFVLRRGLINPQYPLSRARLPHGPNPGMAPYDPNETSG